MTLTAGEIEGYLTRVWGGPVRVEGLPFPLTAKNAAKFLLEDQYLTFGANAQRIDFLDEAAHNVTDRLLHGNLPGPRTVGKVLAGATRGGHLRAAFFDAPSEALFDRLGATGRLQRTPGDSFGLVTQNSSGNKIELFLHRQVDLQTTVDASSGRTATTATVTLHNDAPSTGLPSYVIGNPVGLPAGTNRSYLSLYTTLALTGATLDGAPVQLEQQSELGLSVYSAFVTIPPGGAATLRVQLAGGSRFAGTKASPHYALRLWHQDTVHPDRVSVHVRMRAPWGLDHASGGWTMAGGGATYAGTPRRDLQLDARVAS